MNQTNPILNSESLDDMDDVARTHRPYLVRYIHSRLNDSDLAETITQECLLKAFAARSRYRGDCSVRTWLTTIALNLIRDHLRSNRTRFWRSISSTGIDIAEIHDRIPGPSLNPEAEMLQSERLQRVWEATAILTKKQREVFVMRFVMEMPFSEISATTGTNISTLKTTLLRGIRSIRSRLDDATSSRNSRIGNSRDCQVL